MGTGEERSYPTTGQERNSRKEGWAPAASDSPLAAAACPRHPATRATPPGTDRPSWGWDCVPQAGRAGSGRGFLSRVESSREEGDTIKLKISNVVPEPGAPQNHRGAGRSCPWPRPGQAPGDAGAAGRGLPGTVPALGESWAGFAEPRAEGGRRARGARRRTGPPRALESPCEVAGAFLAVRGGSGASAAGRVETDGDMSGRTEGPRRANRDAGKAGGPRGRGGGRTDGRTGRQTRGRRGDARTGGRSLDREVRGGLRTWGEGQTGGRPRPDTDRRARPPAPRPPRLPEAGAKPSEPWPLSRFPRPLRSVGVAGTRATPGRGRRDAGATAGTSSARRSSRGAAATLAPRSPPGFLRRALLLFGDRPWKLRFPRGFLLPCFTSPGGCVPAPLFSLSAC